MQPTPDRSAPARAAHPGGARLGTLIALALIAPALMALGAGCGPGEDAGSEALPPTPPTALPAFTDATEAAGLGTFRHENGAQGEAWFPETMGAGGGFVDYDGDGHLDVILVGGGAWDAGADRTVRKLWLYRNQGDGTFAPVEDAVLSNMAGYGLGVTPADVDNDGDADLFVTMLGANRLLRNDTGSAAGTGGARFVDVTDAAGVGGGEAWSTAALFFDADRDGWLDLFVGNYVDWSPENDIWCTQDGENKDYCTPELYQGVPPRYYRNRGDGTFEERTAAAGFGGAPGKTLGVTDLDYNADGWPDLAVANDTEPDQLYQNNGDGTFTDVGIASGIAFDERGRARAGMGIDAGVIDGTGQETIVVGNFSNEMIGVYRHRGGGMFLDRAALSKIGRPSLLTLTFGVLLLDVDLDGDLDLFAANGHVQPHIERVKDNITYRQPVHLFINRGDGTFDDVAPALGGVLQRPLVARSASYGDYDGDGDLDLLLTENAGPAHLWRNDLAAAPYLRVQVTGRESNRDGLGTRLVLVQGNRRQVRRIRSGGGFLAASERTATFGLGPAAAVDSLLVYWPSGRVDRLADVPANVPANQTLRLVEGTPPPG